MSSKMFDRAVEKLQKDLKYSRNVSDEDAYLFIAERYDEAMDLKQQMLEFGYSETDAYFVSSHRISNALENEGIESIKYGHMMPLSVLGRLLGDDISWTDSSKKQKSDILWQLGFDTKNFSWFTNSGCFNYDGKRECGLFIQGSERLDRKWLETKINDSSVATTEARFHEDKNQLDILRGNKRDHG